MKPFSRIRSSLLMLSLGLAVSASCAGGEDGGQEAPPATRSPVALETAQGMATIDSLGLHLGDLRLTTLLAPGAPAASGEGATIDRGHGIEEWFRPAPGGLEHGFTLRESVAEIAIPLLVTGVPAEDVRPIAGGYAFGELGYTGLRVIDAAGALLPARMDWRAETHTLWLRVAAADVAQARFPVTVDPLLGAALWSRQPTGQANAEFGASVGFADVNGDGFDDVIAGAPGFGTTFAKEGKAFVYIGSAGGLFPQPAWQLDPTNQAGAQFGRTVAGVGDVDHDGFEDIVVGAPNAKASATSTIAEGCVYLYRGSSQGPGTSPARTWCLTGQAGAGFGTSLAAGDFNGDGTPDIAVGAPGWKGTLAGQGRVFVILGTKPTKPTPHPLPATTALAAVLTTATANAGFGTALAAAGDVNHDGAVDLIVGAPGIGKAFVLRGFPASGSPATISVTLSGNATDGFGRAVSGGVDINGDGFADVAVGAPSFTASFCIGGTCWMTPSAGLVSTYNGSASGTMTLGSLFVGHVNSNLTGGPGAQLGRALGMADFDADGRGDLVAGGPAWGELRDYRSINGVLGAGAVDMRDQSGSAFGAAIAAGADINGDGVSDVIVGSPAWTSATGVPEGRLVVLRGEKDSDADRVFDSVDNCPHTFNPDQRDSDGDHKGDACECDGVTCAPADSCHLAGVCQPTTGACTTPVAPACMVAPSWPEGSSLRAVEVAGDHVKLEWTAATHAIGVDAYHVLRDGAEVAVVNGATLSATVSGLAPGVDYLFKVEASDALADLSAGGPSLLVSTPAPPVAVPPGLALDPTLPSTLDGLAHGIYTGPDARQTGVEPATIDPERVAIIRGKVVDRAGAPVQGMHVSILGNPQYGSTTTDASGVYDLVVNGGETLTVVYQLASYQSAQRTVVTRWGAWVWAEDLVVTPYADPANPATPITAGDSGYQWAQGKQVADADGQRRARLLVPPGTTGVMRFADGHTAPLASPMAVRVTEYTEGAQGPLAMPAALPPASAYTYLVEWDVDEATQRGAVGVEFNQEVLMYVDNFLGFPQRADDPVPTGYYDRQTGLWVPMDNGRVVKVVGVDTTSVPGVSFAQLDVTGDGVADVVNGLGISDAERAQIASVYGVGQSFWRTPLRHFTPVDCNWAYNLPGDARNPNGGPASAENANDHPCEHSGSIIECDDQVLREEIPIAGTPWTLAYTSERAPGRSASRRIRIPLSGAEIPPSVTRMQVEIQVAGRRIRRDFPAAPHQTLDYEWDGKDGLGRVVQGSVTAVVEVRWYFQTVYGPAPSFGGATVQIGPLAAVYRDGAEQYTFTRDFVVVGTIPNTPAQGLGGWSLSPRAELDPVRNRLYHGDGTRLTADAFHMELRRWLGGGQAAIPAADASTAFLESPRGMAVGPDGTLYVTSVFVHPDGSASGLPSVLAVGPRGDVRVLFTKSDVPGGDLGLGARLGALAVGKNGDLYVGDEVNHRVYRRDGRTRVITVFAGSGAEVNSGDGGLATEAGLAEVRALAVAPDGSVYIGGNPSIRRVDTTGKIASISGLVNAPSREGDVATQSRIGVDALAIAPSGNVYVCDANAKMLWRISPNGVLFRAAGNGDIGTGDPLLDQDGGNAREIPLGGCDSVAVLSDETVLVGERNHNNVRRLYGGGKLDTYAGVWNAAPSGTSLRTTRLSNPGFLAAAPNGDVFIGQRGNAGILRAHYFTGASGSIVEPDGSVVHEFDVDHRHVRSRDAVTGRVLVQLAYESHGWLSTVTDADGLVTTVERDASTGAPRAIVGPYGHRTVLEVEPDSGLLAAVVDPLGHRTGATYFPGALLSSFTDARGHASTFKYDAQGRLTHDIDAESGDRQLERLSTVTTRFTSAAGRVSEVTNEAEPDGSMFRLVVAPDGTTTRIVQTRDGRVATLPDGTVVTEQLADDPRFGPVAPYATKMTIAIPGLPVVTMDRVRSVQGFSTTSPFQFGRLTETTTIAGGTSSWSYAPATRTLTNVSAEGLRRELILDATGHVVRARGPGSPEGVAAYDPQGRLTSAASGQRGVSLEYGPEGHGSATAVVDVLGRRAEVQRDPLNRPIHVRQPDGGDLQLGYDENGNPISITPPGRPAHSFGYGAVDDLIHADAPVVDGSGLTWTTDADADGVPRLVVQPDGSTHEVRFDGVGRPQFIIAPEGTATVAFEPDTGRLKSISHTRDVAVGYDYFGSLIHRASWAGEVAGVVSRGYDGSLAVSSLGVNSATPVEYRHDRDGLPMGAGDEVAARYADTRKLSQVTLGRVVEAFGNDANGDYSSDDVTIGGVATLHVDYGHDDVGRLDSRIETLLGATHAYDYTVDPNGRLEDVFVDGALAAHYTYDQNGNRQTATRGAVTLSATYDDRDRLRTYGDRVYGYDGLDNVSSVRAGDALVEYVYDSFSRLRAVHLADGTWIRYVLDATGRRVGKKVQAPGASTATLVEGLLYVDGVRPIAQLDGAGNVTAQFVYGLGRHVPEAMLKGGRTYRLVTDQLGSVRLVVDVATGAIAQRMDYDEFGRVLADSAPGFQPFGFAGGLYEPASGLVHFGAREYDAETGRWMSRDPLGFGGGDSNLYAYVGNYPIDRYDPEGTSWYDDVGNAIIGFGDNITGGASRWLRKKIGLDDVVDPCSLSYSIGNWAGYGVQAYFLVGGLMSLRAGAAAAEGIELVEGAEAACGGGACPCFVAGTEISRTDGQEAIEDIRTGDRVLPSSERCENAELTGWIDVDLEMEGPDGDRFVVQLLRPRSWVEDERAVPGGVVFVDLTDLNVAGWASIVALRSHAPVEKGVGCVVTGTIEHGSKDVIGVELEGGARLEVTKHHRLYSVTRGDWVAAGLLEKGEQLQTRDGGVVVRRIDLGQRPVEPVFNLEIADGHQYYVGSRQVLAHNVYAGSAALTEGENAVVELANKLKFTGTTAKHMEEAGRFVPRSILADAILQGSRMADPQGAAGAIRIVEEIAVNGKVRTLEVVYREADNLILHFLYR